MIGPNDLEMIFSSLGKNESNLIIREMLGESNGPLNFTMFLTLFADKMANTDNENVILNAFSIFDSDKSGKISINQYYFNILLTFKGINFLFIYLRQS